MIEAFASGEFYLRAIVWWGEPDERGEGVTAYLIGAMHYTVRVERLREEFSVCSGKLSYLLELNNENWMGGGKKFNAY